MLFRSGDLQLLPAERLAARHGADSLEQGGIPLTLCAGSLLGGHRLGPADIGGVLAAEGELGEAE